MKKIPTLFARTFDPNGRVTGVTDMVTPGFEWVLNGEGEATVKWDGACCAVIDGKFYKRYDAKHGKIPPENAIPCQEEPDPITGHWPHWVPVDATNPADKWFMEAYINYAIGTVVSDGTYEAVGGHFNSNPYDADSDFLIRHGLHVVDVPRTFDGIRTYLEEHAIEGLVFWKDGEPKVKIKRKDFGIPWPVKNE